MLDRRTVAQWLASLDVSPQCKTAVEVSLASDAGVRTAWQSYLAHLAMVKGHGVERFWTDTEVFRCKGGNQQLARRLAATLPKDRVLLRTPVRAVQVHESSVRVTLADGRVLEAEDVVLSAPPSVWSRIAFDPLLPPGLGIQMNSNVKFLMALRDQFWRRGKVAPDLLSDGPISQTWHGTDGQPGAGAAMVAFSGGIAAEQTREWSATERNERYLAELEKVSRGIRARFVRARYDWPGDPWVRASYSFPSPGQITAFGPTFVEGLGRLPFACEHTSFAFPGYMEGALNSGARVARHLAE
jgi:monoamine oxidase